MALMKRLAFQATSASQGPPGSRSAPVGVISSGSLRLDIAVGLGGIPRGQIIEISGPDSAGKTTLCQHIIAEAQKLGELGALVDTDHALDPVYATRCGVNVDRLYLAQPENEEQALEIVEALVRSGSMAVVVIDSVTALIPKAEIHTRLGEACPEIPTRLLSLALSKLQQAIRQTNTVIIFTSLATPHKTSAVYHQLASNPARLALKLHAGLRLELKPAGQIREEGQIVGIQTRLRVVKNIFGPAFGTTTLDIMYNEGVRILGELLDLGNELSIIKRQASTYIYRDLNLGDGYRNAIDTLRRNPAVAGEIEEMIRQELWPAC